MSSRTSAITTRLWPAPPMASAFALACLTLAGCRGEIASEYGSRFGSSVNGTGVWADMIEAQGHQVSTWPWLSPRLSRDADCIVWFSSDFGPPSAEVRTWLEDWLLDKPQRTLIYVGRDYDAATDYWQQVRQGTSGELFSRLSRRLAEAQADFQKQRAKLKPDKAGSWFTIEPGTKRTINTLTGQPRWLGDVDNNEIKLEITTRLVPPTKATMLLASEKDALVTSEAWGDSQLIVVANGSLLLNLPLVNHEHRKLAGQLIAEIGSPPKKVFFLESRTAEPAIHEQEPKTDGPSVWEIVNIWPMGLVLAHLGILGTIFMASRYPIFGVPRGESDPHASDFGKHVMALGDLLAQTRDIEYARGRLKAYAENVRGDARLGGEQRTTTTNEQKPSAAPHSTRPTAPDRTGDQA